MAKTVKQQFYQPLIEASPSVLWKTCPEKVGEKRFSVCRGRAEKKWRWLTRRSSDILFAFCRSNHLPGQRNRFPRGRVQVNNAGFVRMFVLQSSHRTFTACFFFFSLSLSAQQILSGRLLDVCGEDLWDDTQWIQRGKYERRIQTRWNWRQNAEKCCLVACIPNIGASSLLHLVLPVKMCHNCLNCVTLYSLYLPLTPFVTMYVANQMENDCPRWPPPMLVVAEVRN